MPLQTIKAYKREKEERFKDKVIEANKKVISAPLSNYKKIIKYLYKKAIPIGIEIKNKIIYIGKIKKYNAKYITLYTINAK